MQAFEPDAGLWEYRTRARPHTYSATLCWAACDRLAGIARRLKIADRAKYWATNARSLRERILKEGWDEKRGALTGAFGSPDLDASVLLVAELGLLSSTDDPASSRPATRSAASSCATGGSCVTPRPTISARRRPPFSRATSGTSTLFSQIGRTDEARELFESILARRNAYGLLSEDIHPDAGELWGNLPQTYSMAGIINSATRLSSSWEEAWARD